MIRLYINNECKHFILKSWTHVQDIAGHLHCLLLWCDIPFCVPWDSEWLMSAGFQKGQATLVAVTNSGLLEVASHLDYSSNEYLVHSNFQEMVLNHFSNKIW